LGAFQRKSPTGGAAKGLPLNDATPSFTTPCTSPLVTCTVWIWAKAGHRPQIAIVMANSKSREHECMPANLFIALVMSWGH
jgi:hypothetical protein